MGNGHSFTCCIIMAKATWVSSLLKGKSSHSFCVLFVFVFVCLFFVCLFCPKRYKHFTGAGKLDVMAEAEIARNAEFDFLGFLKRSGSTSGSTRVASDNYLAITVNETACYGGSVCPDDGDSYQAWLESYVASICGAFAFVHYFVVHLLLIRALHSRIDKMPVVPDVHTCWLLQQTL